MAHYTLQEGRQVCRRRRQDGEGRTRCMPPAPQSTTATWSAEPMLRSEANSRSRRSRCCQLLGRWSGLPRPRSSGWRGRRGNRQTLWRPLRRSKRPSAKRKAAERKKKKGKAKKYYAVTVGRSHGIFTDWDEVEGYVNGSRSTVSLAAFSRRSRATTRRSLGTPRCGASTADAAGAEFYPATTRAATKVVALGAAPRRGGTAARAFQAQVTLLRHRRIQWR
jgi:hypothetical protein